MTNTETKIIKTITGVEALNASAIGNPQFKVMCTDGTSYRTKTDAAVNYKIQNSENHNVPVELTLTANGRIVYVNPIK